MYDSLSEKVMSVEFNSLDEFLSKHGIRPTRQRMAIATHIFHKEQHLSADVILERVNNDDSTGNVSKATVYNTLNLFVKEGICLLYTSPSPRDLSTSRMPSSA